MSFKWPQPKAAWLPDHVFVIAEAGVNHNGDPDVARQLIDVAAASGADAVKFQTFRADALVSKDAPKADYQKRGAGEDESQLMMLRRLELSAATFRDLMCHAAAKHIAFLSTPFDEESADLLEELGVQLFKIPSGEITNLPFLQHVARKGKPLVVSTGMSTLGEVEGAVNSILDAGNERLALLHCVSSYPADPADVNLRAMYTLGVAFDVPVGFSDHTPGIEVPLAAVALGACIIEKHFTLDRHLPGPDHRASLEPNELYAMIQGIRKVEMSLGDGRKTPAASETSTAAISRRSLVAAHDIEAGQVITAQLIATRRPGTGLPPMLGSYLIGRTARVDISAGTPLRLEFFS